MAFLNDWVLVMNYFFKSDLLTNAGRKKIRYLTENHLLILYGNHIKSSLILIKIINKNIFILNFLVSR